MKKIISIALAFVILFSCIGIAKSSHICMGSETMAAFGIGTRHLNCGMEDDFKDASHKSDSSIAPVECCQNQFEFVQNDAEQNLKSFNSEAEQLIFITAFTHSFIYRIAPKSNLEQPYPPLSPPPLENEFIILFQSFLI